MFLLFPWLTFPSLRRAHPPQRVVLEVSARQHGGNKQYFELRGWFKTANKPIVSFWDLAEASTRILVSAEAKFATAKSSFCFAVCLDKAPVSIKEVNIKKLNDQWNHVLKPTRFLKTLMSFPLDMFNLLCHFETWKKSHTTKRHYHFYKKHWLPYLFTPSCSESCFTKGFPSFIPQSNYSFGSFFNG